MSQSIVNYENFLSPAMEVAQAAGEILRKYWGKLSLVKEKEHSGDLVTIADQESEALIYEMINAQFPEHSFIGEEGGEKSGKKKEFMWCVDPLDGTTNYTHQLPIFSVSIALLHLDQPVVGVIYNPITNELFHAVQGLGAFGNGIKLHVSKVSELNKSLLVTGFPYNRREVAENNYREFFHMTHVSQGVRRLGSAALDLAYIAAGRLDGYWEKGLKCWDMAAGILLVREAGGLVTAYDKSAFNLFSGNLLATNGKIHDLLSENLCNPYHKLSEG